MGGSTVAGLVEQAAAIVGPEHVEAAPKPAVGPVQPALAVAPGNRGEVEKLVSLARDHGATVVPWGGGSKPAPVLPQPNGLLLRTQRLNALLEWEPADLTVCVEAGMTLADLQRTLAGRGQQAPLDAPQPERTTIGGLVATNTSGPRRWAYGSLRDLVIGMHVTMANGLTVKSGGKVVKNVQGYDLAKLHTGAWGSLGVIVQVNLKLVPLPERRRLFVAAGPLHQVAALTQEIAGSTLRVSAIDIVSAAAASRLGLPGAEATALVLVEGQSAVVSAAAAKLALLDAAVRLRTDQFDEDDLSTLWPRWLDLGRSDDLAADEALLTVSTLPTATEDAVRALEAAGAAERSSVMWWARAGTGIVYARVRAPLGEGVQGLPAIQLALLGRWPATTITAGPAVMAAAQPWGVPTEGRAVMAALKQRFDPIGVFPPAAI